MPVHGDQMQNVTIVEKILRSLQAKFDYIVCSIKESKDIDALSIDELQSSLLLHERKVNRNSNNTKEKALKASTYVKSSSSRGRGRGRGRRKGRGGQEIEMEEGRSQVPDMKIIHKVKGKVVISILTKLTLNATCVTILITIILNVIPSCPAKNKRCKNPILHKIKKQ